MELVHIVALGEGCEFDGFRALGAVFHPFAIRVTSVEDMVDQILASLEAGGEARGLCLDRRILALDIVDHGTATSQWVGSDRMTATSENVSILARLAPRMARDAVVTLEGCRVGYAQELLQRVSRVLGGVRVRAGTARSRHFPGLEGSERECRGDTCTATDHGFWDWVDVGIDSLR